MMGPVYKRNCLNSVAFHKLKKCNSRGLRTNSTGTTGTNNFKIFFTNRVDNRTFNGPDNQKFNIFFTIPMQTKCI